MAEAMWKGVVLAESDRIEMVEVTVYFLQDSMEYGYFED
jgi:hypothetical protein